MIEVFKFTNVKQQTITYNDLVRPLHDFDTEVELRGDERNKMQQAGIWPHYRYPGKLLIHIVGDLLGNASSDFMQKRDSDLNILNPFGINEVQRTRRYGTLTVQFTGLEVMTADVSLDAYPHYPLGGLSPSRCEFNISFLSFTPYMTGVSGRAHYI